MFAAIVWTDPVKAQLQKAARKAAPREMAAVLGGYVADQTAYVQRMLLLPNQSANDDTFEVDGVAFAQCEHQLRLEHRTFLGFAHSHPEGIAAPSRRDRELLWPDCVQVITDGTNCNAFRLDAERIAHPLSATSQPEGALK